MAPVPVNAGAPVAPRALQGYRPNQVTESAAPDPEGVPRCRGCLASRNTPRNSALGLGLRRQTGGIGGRGIGGRGIGPLVNFARGF